MGPVDLVGEVRGRRPERERDHLPARDRHGARPRVLRQSGGGDGGGLMSSPGIGTADCRKWPQIRFLLAIGIHIATPASSRSFWTAFTMCITNSGWAFSRPYMAMH